ncbi:MAG: hypothetical protein JKY53_10200 [Flavobacteriales bacterium]|nr:hypothetical protein [Flavobacteriales bacterium]
MRKSIFMLGAGMLFMLGNVTFVSCGEEKPVATEATTEEAHAHYQCPMKCEGDKVYETAVKCPKCDMDTKEV